MPRRAAAVAARGRAWGAQAGPAAVLVALAAAAALAAVLAVWRAPAAVRAAAKVIGADGSLPPGPNTWRMGIAKSLLVYQYDQVVFTWNAGATHSLVQMPNLVAWNRCDFSQPNTHVLLGPSASGDYVVGPTDPGFVMLLASGYESDCVNGLKIKITFRKTTPLPTKKPTATPGPPTPTMPTASPTSLAAKCSAFKTAKACHARPACRWKSSKCVPGSG